METNDILGGLGTLLGNTMGAVNLAINGLNKDQKKVLKKELKKRGFDKKMKEAQSKFEELAKIDINGTN